MIVCREFSRQGEHHYFQQLQLLENWLRQLLPPFSIHELRYRELELIEANHNPTPVEQRTQIRQVTGEVLRIFWGGGVCFVANVLRRGDLLPENFQQHDNA
jgi:hypothetical protein